MRAYCHDCAKKGEAAPFPPLANRPLGGDQAEACERDVAERGYSQWAGQTLACWAVLHRGQAGMRRRVS